MLKSTLLHPQLLSALAGAGHGSQILLADANYPVSTASSMNASRVYLNLRPGLVNVPQVLEALLTAVPVEGAHVMCPDEGAEPTIFGTFRKLLPDFELTRLARPDFYSMARRDDLAVVIATGERAHYANLLLTIGVVSPN